MKATIVDIYNKVMHKKTQELVSGEEAKKWASGRNASDWSDGFDTAMQIAADIIACYYKDLANQKQFSMQEELAVRTAMDRVCCKIVEEQDALIMQAEFERLQKENEILSTNADNAFQEGLNESRELFKQEVEAAIRAEAVKEFAKFLIDRSEGGVISVADLPELVIVWERKVESGD